MIRNGATMNTMEATINKFMENMAKINILSAKIIRLTKKRMAF